MTTKIISMFKFFYPNMDILKERDSKNNNLAHIIIKDFHQ